MAVVTFTTDFGTRDAYAAAMKGVVLQLAPDAVLVDVTHEVRAQDVRAGALVLAQAAPHFPRGTIHVAVVDPGVGGARAEVVVAAEGSYFVGPDNGLLALAARRPRQVWRIANPAFRREPASPTFHGRDVFAPAAGRIASGRAAAEAGPAMPDLAPLAVPADTPIADGAAGEVLRVDVYGNLITSFTGAAPDGTWDAEIGAARFALAGGRTFCDVEAGALVLYAGSGGHIEIAVRDGSAALLSGASAGTAVRLWRRP